MIGEYKIKVWKEVGYYLAKVTFPNGETHMTQGTDKDIFYMIGDLISCYYDIKIPFWKRWIIRLFNL